MTSIAHNICDINASSFSLLSDGVASGLIYTEQFLATPETCQAPGRPAMLAYNRDAGRAILFRPSCKSWGCPVCGPINRNRWIVRALKGVEQLTATGQHVDFLTITSHEKLRGEASWRVLPLAWDNLGQRYHRALSTGLPGAYMAVPERHHDGSAHAHLLITGNLPARWWKDNARSCGLGYMTDVQEVVTLGIAGYVGKYLGKTLAERWPKGKRRVNCSRSWPALASQIPPGWTMRRIPQGAHLAALAADLDQQGFDVILATPETAWLHLEV